MDKDPIKRMAALLVAHEILTDDEVIALETEADREIAAAIEAAKAGPDPEVADLTRDVYTELAA